MSRIYADISTLGQVQFFAVPPSSILIDVSNPHGPTPVAVHVRNDPNQSFTTQFELTVPRSLFVDHELAAEMPWNVTEYPLIYPRVPVQLPGTDEYSFDSQYYIQHGTQYYVPYYYPQYDYLNNEEGAQINVQMCPQIDAQDGSPNDAGDAQPQEGIQPVKNTSRDKKKNRQSNDNIELENTENRVASSVTAETADESTVACEASDTEHLKSEEDEENYEEDSLEYFTFIVKNVPLDNPKFTSPNNLNVRCSRRLKQQIAPSDKSVSVRCIVMECFRDEQGYYGTVKADVSDADIRDALVSKGSINVGGRSCIVVRNPERINAFRCYHCQAYRSHDTRNCQASRQYCMKCSGDHSLQECPVRDYREYRCINCVRKGKPRVNHMAATFYCPIELKERIATAKALRRRQLNESLVAEHGVF